MNDNILTLNINSTVFDQMKEDFDKVLNRTLANMLEKESQEAVLSLKLKIGIEKVDVRDYDAADENAKKTINKPSFAHKLGSVMQIKTQESGEMKGEYELVWDENRNEFIMKPIDNGQASFFDAEFVYADDEDAEEDGEPLALPECEDEDE